MTPPGSRTQLALEDDEAPPPPPEETTPASDIVRPDRNLEKWPIWEPSNSRHAPRARLIQREVRLPDGSKAVATVEVGFSNKGALTTEDQKTCYGLIKLWEEEGRPTEPVYFSRQRLAKTLKRSWGSNVNAALTASLMRLRFTPFTWERSYYDNSTRETVERIDTFNILSELHLSRRSADGHTTREASYFRFNERILRNLLSHYTKPVFLDTILSFQSEIAQILYTHLDLVLSDKSHYERRTRELFEDLGIDGSAYRYPSKRAQVLEPALRELRGSPLPTGFLREVGLEKTADGKDLKIVVRKGRPRGPRPGTRKGAPPAEPQLLPPVVTEGAGSVPNGNNGAPRAGKGRGAPPRPAREPGYAPEDPAAALAQVRHFYQTFFRSGETAHPTARELAQADDHVRRLGEEPARYLVTFAYRESKQTGFAIQTYGGVLQYEGRAVAEFAENARKRAEALLQKARKSHEERFWAPYSAYLASTLVRREEAPSEAFRAFLAAEAEERRKFTQGPLAQNPAMKRRVRIFDGEAERLQRFAEFFRAAAEEDRVLDFWGWDAALNPERFPGPGGP